MVKYDSAGRLLETLPPDPRDPDYSREGLFIYHNCYRCRHGVKACVHGDPRRCSNLHARND